jgi:nitrite reductase (NADH) small subunit
MNNVTKICLLSDIVPNTAVNALFEGKQVAIFRLYNDELFALDNKDPFSDANVLSRGLLGISGDIPYITSPIYKQRFNLLTGQCLDNEDVMINTYPVSLKDSAVYLG